MKFSLYILLGSVLVHFACSECKFWKQKPDSPDSEAMERIRGISEKLQRVRATDLKYTYDIGICNPARADGSNKTVGVIQTNHDGSSPHDLGKTTNASVLAGRTWILLEYGNGDKRHSACKDELRKSHIMLTCSPDATEPVPSVVEENTNLTTGCYYLFEIETKLACPPEKPTGGTLSVGSVVCIVFAALVAVYLLGGAIYQRLVVGAKGLEQIPNYAFWQDCGNLQADGCDLVCRSFSRSRGSREYTGVGDEQIRTDLDYRPSQDDSLLPM